MIESDTQEQEIPADEDVAAELAEAAENAEISSKSGGSVLDQSYRGRK